MAKTIAENPMAWTEGQPKSESENWQFRQRSETPHLSSQLLESMLHGHDSTLGQDDNALADRATALAARLIQNADRRFPRA